MEIAVLGPLAAQLGEKSVVPSAAKPRQVLALLALDSGRKVSVAALAEELWGDRPPRSSAATLHTYVKQLRHLIAAALGPAAVPGPREILSRQYNGYVLDAPPDGTDAVRFERLARQGRSVLEGGDAATASDLLERALGLWRGPALADVTPGPLLEAEVLRLEELRRTALEDRITADLRLGRHDLLLGELTGLTARFPLHERLHGQLMVALCRSGRTWQALEVYGRLRTACVERLGLEPCPELRRLHQAVLTQDPSLTEWSVA
ncbi:AfsR/SARP family transcriptional regulator [Streptomyces sp. NBC_00287]|uniref:AfsR/SARP family transcriptional regulator n=1 Tax=Streptomyces sp. NBC_00287 TaxID=2975702 RepID=UPI002E2BAB86|nr:AfsR/SARP family transcriptional regulator [Streptomyces sp. NBC_00287]